MYPDRRIVAMELFVHDQGEEIDVVEADGAVLVATFIEEHGEDGEVELWLEDADAPLGRELTLADAGVGHHAHLHLSKSKKIHTFVTSTFQKVFDWATSKPQFELTPEQKAKHTLEIAGTEIEPEMTAHIEQYATEHVLRLNLVPKDRHAG
jgi:hypothetical protein